MSVNTHDEAIAFLRQHHHEPVVLSAEKRVSFREGLLTDGAPEIVVCPDLCGRVVSAGFGKRDVENPLFINPPAITATDFTRSYHPEGGHRWWPLPEGQRDWSLYFPRKEKSFMLGNWKVPPNFDKISFLIEERRSSEEVSLRAPVVMTNVKGSIFELIVRLYYRIEPCPERAGFEESDDLLHVGYSQGISFKNIGQDKWDENHGMIAPWSLVMLTAGSSTWVVLPVEAGSVSGIVDFRMSGQDSRDRIDEAHFIRTHNCGLLRADGKCRGKLGIPPDISNGFIASIDLVRGLLVVMHVPVQKEARYIDNSWNAASRFGGTAIDCFNGGGVPDNGTEGGFFEMEGVSPAKEVIPGQRIDFGVTVHFFKVTGGRRNYTLLETMKNITGIELSEEALQLQE